MAKTPKTPGRSAPRKPTAPQREAIVDATLALVAERGWRPVSFADIAGAAGVSLADLYALFPDKQAVLAAYAARVDRAMLAGADEDLAAEGRRDRLFDLLMRRFDALGQDRAAVRAILADAARDPALALGGGARLLRSMAWTLESAGIASSGIVGALRVKTLTLLYLSAMRVWVEDDSADLARTMAAVDARLRRAERFLGA
ncbi:MAG: TetR family transcriptional regulator [Alphaproteobacteria bacterium]